ncbi:MAG: hypothetical protein ABH826_04695 [Patescibacteria group bacterium]
MQNHLDPILDFMRAAQTALSQPTPQLNHARNCIDMVVDDFEDPQADIVAKQLSGLAGMIKTMLNESSPNLPLIISMIEQLIKTYLLQRGPPPGEPGPLELLDEDIELLDDEQAPSQPSKQQLPTDPLFDSVRSLKLESVAGGPADLALLSRAKGAARLIEEIEIPTEAVTVPAPPPRQLPKRFTRAVFVTKTTPNKPLLAIGFVFLMSLISFVTYMVANELKKQNGDDPVPVSRATVVVNEPQQPPTEPEKPLELTETQRRQVSKRLHGEKHRIHVTKLQPGLLDPFGFTRIAIAEAEAAEETTPDPFLPPTIESSVQATESRKSKKTALREVDCRFGRDFGDEVWVVLWLGDYKGTTIIRGSTIRENDQRCVFAAGSRAGTTIPAECFQSTKLGLHPGDVVCPEWELLGLH